MTDSLQIAIDSEQAIIKLKNSLDQLVERNNGSSDASAILSEALASFKQFFDELKNPEFSPVELKTGDTPRSEDYNSNLKQIYNDISRFYKDLNNLNNSAIKAFNYSQVITNELRKRADSIAGMVLDLKILNNFTRGDVIVAGDDFINFDKINKGAGLSAPIVELISNGSGLSLARSGTNNLTSDPSVKVEIIPLSPQGSNANGTSEVNTNPTPGNFERFYEGCYYAFVGLARPEGNKFNIREIVVPPKPIDPPPPPTKPLEPPPRQRKKRRGFLGKLSFILGPVQGAADRLFRRKGERNNNENTVVPQKPPVMGEPESFFVEYGASEEKKEANRRRMFDNNPDTFWECEYIVPLSSPLIPDITESLIVTEVPGQQENSAYAEAAESPTASAIQIDVNNLNLEAVERDTLDFSIDIILTLREQQNVNFVSINPVLFSKNAFVDVTDISTASENEGVFLTVDGWESLRFPKTLTPEANEYLTDSQLTASLSPSRFEYSGQGIFPFPIRIAKKIKITLVMRNPASQPYEKTYALLKKTIDIETTTTTTTKRSGIGLPGL